MSYLCGLACIGGMSLILNQVLSEPLVVTQKYKTGFNILFVLFVLPMFGLSVQVMSSYAKHKKMCHCRVISYFLLVAVIFVITILEGKMIYMARSEMKRDLRAPCAKKLNSGLLGRFEGFDNRAREMFCSDACPCNLAIPYPKDRMKKTCGGRKLKIVRNALPSLKGQSNQKDVGSGLDITTQKSKQSENKGLCNPLKNLTINTTNEIYHV